MPAFTVTIDTQISIFERIGDGPTIGVESKWGTTPFPSTQKTIDGFFFDDKKWGGQLDKNDAHFVPVLWDPTSIGVRDLINPGIGDNNDLLLTSINTRYMDDQNVWSPRIHHGFYYSEGEEFYLHSDSATIDFVGSGLLLESGNIQQLSYVPKEGIPVLAMSYEWKPDEGIYVPYRSIRKVIEFEGRYTDDGQLRAQDGNTIFWGNVNSSEEQFFLDYTTTPPTAIFNQNINRAIGSNFPTLSGLNAHEIDSLDDLGIATGIAGEEFHLKYSPVSRDFPVSVYSDYYGTSFQEYTVVEEFTVSGLNQVVLDYDLGIVKFGSEGLGGVAPLGSTVRAAYRLTAGIEYEPKDSKDYVEGAFLDLNPIRRFSGSGFVFIRNRTEEIYSLELEAILTEISENYYGPLLLGNNFASIRATAYTENGEAVEGQEITFEIIGLDIGTFGASTEATAFTNAHGQATTLYNPPRTIDTLGGVTDSVTITASGSQLYLSDYVPASEDSSLFLFQIAKQDTILGIPRADLPAFYTDFLAEEGTEGPYITHDLSDSFSDAWQGLSVLLANAVKWEVWHREVHGIPTPIIYEPSDLRTGKKTVIAQYDATAINPHTGTTPAIVPVQPVSFTASGVGTVVNFDETLTVIDPTSVHKSYLVVGPSRVTIRAKTTNERTGQTILSNEIDILIDIPDAAKGLFEIETLNSIPSGLLTNFNMYDSVEEDGQIINLVESAGLLPLGWRLRSTGITLASALNGLTFLDLNPPAQSYTEDEVTASGEYLNSFTHQLEVVI